MNKETAMQDETRAQRLASIIATNGKSAAAFKDTIKFH